jgi:hypothetical protein
MERVYCDLHRQKWPCKYCAAKKDEARVDALVSNLYDELDDETLFGEFKSFFNYARNNPDEYAKSIETRERLRVVVAEMKKRGFNVNR